MKTILTTALATGAFLVTASTVALSPDEEEYERCMARAEYSYHVMTARLEGYNRYELLKTAERSMELRQLVNMIYDMDKTALLQLGPQAFADQLAAQCERKKPH